MSHGGGGGAVDIGTLTGRIELQDGMSSVLTMLHGKVGSAESAFHNLDLSVKSVGVAVGATGLAVVGAVTGIAASIAHMAEKGSKIQGVEDAFEKLAEKAGKTSQQMIGPLSDALKGTVDDMEMLQSMNRVLGAGVELTDKQMFTLGATAREMAKAFGQDATTSLNGLNMALVTGNQRLLKRMGIQVDFNKAEIEFAAKLGATKEQLNAEGILQAKRIAMLEAMQKRLDKMGESEMTFKEKMDAAKVATEQWFEKLEVGIARSPAVLQAFDRIRDAINRAIGTNSTTLLEALLHAVDKFATKLADTADTVSSWIEAWRNAPSWLKSTTTEIIEMTAMIWLLNKAIVAVQGTALFTALMSRIGVGAAAGAVAGAGTGAGLTGAAAFEALFTPAAATVGGVGAGAGIGAAITGGLSSMMASVIAFVTTPAVLATIIGSVMVALRNSSDDNTKYRLMPTVGMEGVEPSVGQIKAMGGVLPLTPNYAGAWLAGQQGFKFPETPSPKVGPLRSLAPTEHDAGDKAKYLNDQLSAQQEALLKVYGATVRLTPAQEALVKNYADLGASGADIAAAFELYGPAVQKFLSEYKTGSERAAEAQKSVTQEGDMFSKQMSGMWKQSWGHGFDSLDKYKTLLQSTAIGGIATMYKATETLTLKNGTLAQAYDVVRDKQGHVIKWTDALTGEIHTAAEETTTFTERLGEVAGALGSVFNNINSKAGQAFQVLSNLWNTMKDHAVSTGAKIVAAFAAAADIVNSLFGGKSGKGAAAATGIASGVAAGAGLGFMFGGPVGAGIGAAIGGIAGLFGGLAANAAKMRQANADATAQIKDMHAELVKTYGSLANLQTIGKVLGIEIPSDLERGTKGLEHYKELLDAFKLKMDLLNGALSDFGMSWLDLGEEFKQMATTTSANKLVDQFNVLVAAGAKTDYVIEKMSGSMSQFVIDSIKAGTKIPAAMQPMLEKMIRMGKITKEAAEAMLGMTTEALPSLADITAAADRYGLKLSELGDKVQVIKIGEDAKQLVADWETFTKAGVDPAFLATSKFGDSVQELVKNAIKYGAELPETMKPMLEAMLKAGKLTDENGDKLTDLSKLTFAKDLTQMFDTLIEKLDKLIEKISSGVGGALDGIDGKQVDVNVHVTRSGDVSPDEQPLSYAGGGVIYAASGYWRPRGSDTVPAMLTPGERVLSVAENRDYERGGTTNQPVYVQVGDETLVKAMVKIGRKRGWLRG